MLIIKELLKKNKVTIIFSSIIIFAIIFILLIHQKEETEASSIPKKETEIKTTTNKKEEVTEKYIYAEIKGAVVSPGVYPLKENSRIVDLITIAGGLKDDANIDYINQSKIIEDQMVIKIYTNSEIEESNKVEVITKYIDKECNCPKITNDGCIEPKELVNQTEQNGNSSTTLVNINNCTKDDLLSLPGIGESKAVSIIQYRTENGKFNSVEDIKNVTGIGQSLYDKIKDYIEV